MAIIKTYYGFSVENYAKKIGNFLRLFHESMAALVQGYREVTMDASGKFRFDNQETVKDRTERFEAKLKSASSGLPTIVNKNDTKQ